MTTSLYCPNCKKLFSSQTLDEISNLFEEKGRKETMEKLQEFLEKEMKE